jgi:hypothetical protein
MKDAKNRIRDIKEISIAIDTWDDIFSDFDPRPFESKVLSEDFISELKKRYRENRKGDFVIIIFAPEGLRDEKTQEAVTKRLKRHFLHRYLQKQKAINRIRARGITFVVLGVIFLSFITLSAYYGIFSDLVTELLSIIFMPLGWFGIWEGFSKIVDTSQISLQEAALFKKLAKADYRFNFLKE